MANLLADHGAGRRRDREQALQETGLLQLANERLALALRGSYVGVWDFDLRDHSIREAPVYSVNLWEPLGYESDAQGAGSRSDRYHPDRWHPDDREGAGRALEAFVEGETAEFAHEWRFRHKDGSYRWFLNRGAALRDAEGRAIRFLGSSVDITDRRRLEEELRRAKESAEAGNRAKDDFLANVSHEIRTPMNAILGLTELVLDTPLRDDQRKLLQTVESAAESLLGIINDLLDFSKIEAGKIELAPGAFMLRASLSDTLRALATRAHRKGLELVCSVSADVPDALIGDAGRLRQVLINLVGNAIKFTDRGEVEVQVGLFDGPPAPDQVILRFSVRDTGLGIARDKQAAIFRAFEQEDTSTTRRYGGTGLGLTIASRLIALMQGEISLDSEPGRGSTFSFSAHFERQPSPPLETRERAPVMLRGLRVLIVDDNAVNRQILETWLRDWQMDVTAVGDGMAAMDALWHGVASGRPYALTLLDARMPHTDGFSLAAMIRERAELSPSRIILLTSSDRPGDLMRSRELRIDAHLLKPVAQAELLDTIQAVMRQPGGDAPAAAWPAAPPPATAPAPAAGTGLSVLVAEDNEFNAQLFHELLSRRGHDVRIAQNGREAIQLLERERFDLLLLDLHMPDMDGFEVIHALRERERSAGGHLPVIAVTARSRPEDRERVLAAGMDDFLAKPIQAAGLWAAIERVMTLAVPENRPARAILDPDAVLAACGGDAGLLGRLCAILRARLRADLADLDQALRDGDAARLRDRAHHLSSMVAAFSTRAGLLVSEVEDLAAAGTLEGAGVLLAELNCMADELLEAVDGLSLAMLERDRGALSAPS